jgi:hypothetical protein
VDKVKKLHLFALDFRFQIESSARPPTTIQTNQQNEHDIKELPREDENWNSGENWNKNWSD